MVSLGPESNGSQSTPEGDARSSASYRIVHVCSDMGEAVRLRVLLEGSAAMAFQVVRVAKLEDALALPGVENADALLLDVSDDPAEGFAQLGELRLRVPGVPVIVLGDEDEESRALEALRLGAGGYLLKKETTTRLLVTTLGATLGSHRTSIALDSARQHARHLATHDPLTGLANRLLFNDRLVQSLAAARRTGQVLAVLSIDLDGFRGVNDSLGESVGDGLLRGVAHHLTSGLRDTDTAARVGGDEFFVLLTQLSDELDAVKVAADVLEALDEPVSVGERSVSLTASIGIATFPRDGADAEALLRCADTALRHAKERGRNRFEFYRADMKRAGLKRLDMESRLREALRDGGLELYYQPQYDLRRKKIVGSEALIRWRHPELGAIPPAEFLPVAESTGLIIPMGEWVLRTACRQNAIWHQLGHRGARVAVNVSSHQFQEPGFATLVAMVLEESDLRADSLELEITESGLLEDVDTTLETMYALKRIGVRLSIDDFGTGYSALSYLKRLPVDALKIDQSFVRSATTQPVDAAIIETIVRLAQGISLAVVAEGVETPEQLLLLASYGCHRMQGYLFGRPAPPETLARWLANPPFRWMRDAPLGAV